MAGGPPVRGDLLPIWEPSGALTAAERDAWKQAARRIAAGLRELAHLPTTLDDELGMLAFPCVDGADAARWGRAIASEHVEARVIIDQAGTAGVQLPCQPHATDEEIRHVVLACVKAAHAQLGPAVSPTVAAQIESMVLAEQIVGDVAARLRDIGTGIRHELACRLRRP